MAKRIDIKLNARYFTHGNPDAENLIVVLHGYGHLASYFIKKFQFLDPSKYFVVAPEGLHRFYLNGTDGRVGASWMTKEDRENDIQNYIQLLNTILKEVNSTNKYNQKILLGFSQGGATASRYIAFGAHSFDTFILWAAVFPPDLKLDLGSKFDASKNYFVVGKKDKYYTAQQIDAHIVELNIARNRDKMRFDLIKFDGEHEIHEQTLRQILS